MINLEEARAIVARYNSDYREFMDNATKEERQEVFQYITREANRMQRRVMGLE
ncbi:hypothetical protein G6R29_05200 [Fructobacillus sp. M2-14]|uniref:Uncharacterized protein n=1 Tax=Fructobacillus broussonetiae TaxID=2713173 RepID=A0ABS5R2W5_9LACO|nr:hypothetical protein [Fructobacillus broussonetiae]MBS9339016.1 hypothetical protein [Fructobacillus broussonetiae]